MADERKDKKNLAEEITEEILSKDAKPQVSLLRKLLLEFLRVSPLLALVIPFLFTDDSYKLVLFISAVLSFVLILVHIVRKSMYPYIDIEALIKKAEESPIGASIALLGVMIFLSTIMLTFAILLSR